MDRIYALIPEQRLAGVLSVLHDSTDLAVRLLDQEGRLLRRFGNIPSYCNQLNQSVFPRDTCREMYIQAGQRAHQFGEAYVFTCQAELNLITFPLVSRGDLLGTVLMGPFLLDTPDSSLMSGLVEQYSLSSAASISLYDKLVEVPVITTARANILKRLTEQLLEPLLPDAKSFLSSTKKRMYQQARVNETIQIYKDREQETDLRTLFAQEEDLLAKVRTGSTDAALQLLDGWIAQIIYAEGGCMERLQAHAASLSVQLARTVIGVGADPGWIMELQTEDFKRIFAAETQDDLTFCLHTILERDMAAAYGTRDAGNQHIRRALRYMAEHYHQPITLESTAKEVGLSPNHFSTLFRSSVGIGFREHLCRIRVEESKKLLASTDNSLTDIAVAMGFNDQSYFCKVFKRITGMPPGQFRNQ